MINKAQSLTTVKIETCSVVGFIFLNALVRFAFAKRKRVLVKVCTLVVDFTYKWIYCTLINVSRKMNFTILDRWGRYPVNARNEVFLTWDDWNDYSYYTTFGIFYVDESYTKHNLSGINLAFKGQNTDERVFHIGDRFSYVGDNYFSMGSSDEYYEKLNKLDFQIKNAILDGLNDIAKHKEIYDAVEDEPVVRTSFFRSLNPSTVTGQFRRMAHGETKLTPYSFSFVQPKITENSVPLSLSFEVMPESLPPTNIHVLIGRNGVGKTLLINNMVDALLTDEFKPEPYGQFIFNESEVWGEDLTTFANLISVSFSAFDETELKPAKVQFVNDIKYSYIGLRQRPEENESNQKIKDPTMLPNEFANSLEICRSNSVKERWLRAVTTLQSDPNFEQAGIIDLINLDNSKSSRARVLRLFRRLSSGHKIVLLTITKLIEKLQERSLVIMDEPEAHLHPPLLSAFIRAVSDLLISTNGVAIVATHSPVILQEVPKSCAWRLSRIAAHMQAERPQRESFGENVGILTNDIFRLEVTQSGFYKMLLQVIEEKKYDYNAVIAAFDGQLGLEARSILMATISSREN